MEYYDEQILEARWEEERRKTHNTGNRNLRGR